MGRMQDIALELLGEIKDTYEQGDDLADLVKPDGHPYGINPLYLGQIGRYEVWQSRSGYGVWLGDVCQCIAFETLGQAVEYARELNAKAMDEEARYLAIRRFPVPSRGMVKADSPKPARKARQKKQHVENFSVDYTTV
jgi:hypothetical protein